MALGSPSQPLVRPIHVGKEVVQAEVVSSEAARELGLSGRSGLAPNSGMLFEFDQDGAWGIWMKDMSFSIDIVWADAAGKVIYIVQDAAPQSYPTIFTPPSPAHYVVELPAGFVAAHGVALGDKIVI